MRWLFTLSATIWCALAGHCAANLISPKEFNTTSKDNVVIYWVNREAFSFVSRYN